MTKSKLPKFTLTHNKKRDRWELAADRSNQVVKTFHTKADATAGGALKSALGTDGGSVKIQKVDGKFQEERTFPKSADPKQSPG